jgi:hypothetical protein
MSDAKVKSLVLLTFITILTFTLPAGAASPANDPVSGLPLPPDLRASNDAIDLNICGHPGKANQYLMRSSTVAIEIAWFKAHLAGYKLYHAFWDNRSQDTFYSADGTKGVTITGIPGSDTVFSLMYLRFATGLTEHQRASFSPSNPSCK